MSHALDKIGKIMRGGYMSLQSFKELYEDMPASSYRDERIAEIEEKQEEMKKLGLEDPKLRSDKVWDVLD